MKVIAVSTLAPQADNAKIEAHYVAEAEAAWRLMMEGFIREAYFRDDNRGVVFVVEAESVEQVRRRFADFPYVAHGLLTFEYIPVGPFRAFDDLVHARSAPRP